MRLVAVRCAALLEDAYSNLQIQFIHMSGQPDDPKVDAIEIVSGGVTGP